MNYKKTWIDEWMNEWMNNPQIKLVECFKMGQNSTSVIGWKI